MRQIKGIVIHCTATRENIEYSVDQVRQWHKLRGFRDIGYHFLVHLDGSIEKGRPIKQSGAHAKGHNSDTVAVCYVGGLDTNNKPKDTRTKAQIYGLRNLVDVLKIIYPEIESTVGHRDLSVDLNGDGVITKNEWMKSCPCFEVKAEL